MTDYTEEPPEPDDGLLPEGYDVQGYRVFHMPGCPGEWIKSDTSVELEDQESEEGHWETARDQLGER